MSTSAAAQGGHSERLPDAAAFLRWRSGRPEAALEAAAALLAGELGPARALLDLPAPALEQLREASLEVEEALLHAVLAPAHALELPARLAETSTALSWRSALAAGGGRWDTEPTARLAWAIDTLRLLDEEARHQALPRQERADAGMVAQLWAHTLGGRYWQQRAQWQLLGAAAFRRGVASVWVGMGVAPDRYEDTRHELLDAFVDLMDTPEGRRDLLARTLEQAALHEAATWLATLERGRAARCLVRRDTTRASLQCALTGLVNQRREVQAVRAETLLGAPEQVAAWLRVDRCLGLIRRWSLRPASPVQTREAARRLQSRLRARLRALFREGSPTALLPRVLVLPGLAACTTQAIAQLGRDHARQLWLRGLAQVDPSAPSSPPCVGAGLPETLDPELLPVLRSWVALVVLRGQLGRLQAWAGHAPRPPTRTGSWTDLLSCYLPEELLDEAELSTGRLRIQATLARSLPAILASIRPVLARVAALPYAPTVHALHAAVHGDWDAAVHLPQRGLQKLRANAVAALATLDAP